MYHVSAQGVDERMINVHYYYIHLGCQSYMFYLPKTCFKLIIFYLVVITITERMCAWVFLAPHVPCAFVTW